MKKLLKIDSFWLRIVALLTMTLDHVGACLDFRNFFILRLIGRIALPLFIFLTVEGALKTSNRKKYILRIGIFAAVIGIVLGILAFLNSPFQEIGLSGNIFLDLLLVILSIAIIAFFSNPLYVLLSSFVLINLVFLLFKACYLRK